MLKNAAFAASGLFPGIRVLTWYGYLDWVGEMVSGALVGGSVRAVCLKQHIKAYFLRAATRLNLTVYA